MHCRVHLPFEILTNDRLEAARTGNWFLENDLAIARLDKLSRNEDVQQKLSVPDCRYDLVVCDEAHKLSATFFGSGRADDLQARLQRRLAELDREAQISALPPVVLGGLVVVPLGLVAAMTGRPLAAPASPADTQAFAARARAVVMEGERALGFEPTDRELEKLGYDIESRVVSGPDKGRLRFIEVKGRVTGADTVSVTKNEILTSLDKPDDFTLAIVEFLDEATHQVRYLRRPFQREPGFGVPASTTTSPNCWRGRRSRGDGQSSALSPRESTVIHAPFRWLRRPLRSWTAPSASQQVAQCDPRGDPQPARGQDAGVQAGPLDPRAGAAHPRGLRQRRRRSAHRRGRRRLPGGRRGDAAARSRRAHRQPGGRLHRATPPARDRDRPVEEAAPALIAELSRRIGAAGFDEEALPECDG